MHGGDRLVQVTDEGLGSPHIEITEHVHIHTGREGTPTAGQDHNPH